MREGVEIELSPFVTYTGEGLGLVKGKTFTRWAVASAVEELDAGSMKIEVIGTRMDGRET